MQINIRYPEYPKTKLFQINDKEIVPIYVLSHPHPNKVSIVFDYYNGNGGEMRRVGTIIRPGYAGFIIDHTNLILELNTGNIAIKR